MSWSSLRWMWSCSLVRRKWDGWKPSHPPKRQLKSFGPSETSTWFVKMWSLISFTQVKPAKFSTRSFVQCITGQWVASPCCSWRWACHLSFLAKDFPIWVQPWNGQRKLRSLECFWRTCLCRSWWFRNGFLNVHPGRTQTSGAIWIFSRWVLSWERVLKTALDLQPLHMHEIGPDHSWIRVSAWSFKWLLRSSSVEKGLVPFGHWAQLQHPGWTMCSLSWLGKAWETVSIGGTSCCRSPDQGSML